MKVKSENGAITLYVLIAMLAFTAISVGIFINSANKQRTQLEAVEQLKAIYETGETAEEAYQKYVGGAVIPIYTAEQLLAIGNGNSIMVDGKLYSFAKGNTYVLQNDITVKGSFSPIYAMIKDKTVTFESQGYKVFEIYNGITTEYTGAKLI